MKIVNTIEGVGTHTAETMWDQIRACQIFCVGTGS